MTRGNGPNETNWARRGAILAWALGALALAAGAAMLAPSVAVAQGQGYTQISYMPNAMPNPGRPVSAGTGFLFNGTGGMITAWHVVEDCTSVEVLRNGRRVPAKVVDYDSGADVAILQTAISGDVFLELGNPRELRPFERMSARGYRQPHVAGAYNRLRGAFRKDARHPKGLLMQVRHSGGPGMSGGPVTANGRTAYGVVIGGGGLLGNEIVMADMDDVLDLIDDNDMTRGMGPAKRGAERAAILPVVCLA